MTLTLADEDDPDPVVDGKIDLGALAAEFFALGLDPYPRKPGAEFVAPVAQAPPDSPFTALAGRRASDSGPGLYAPRAPGERTHRNAHSPE